MKPPVRFTWEVALLLMLVAYPFLPAFEQTFLAKTGRSLGAQMPTLFVFAILALALNVVVGYTGLLHLGIAAFFGIGAYVTGILTVPAYPFEWGMWVALIAGTIAAALVGLLLGGPLLRMRGDYLALVTLGFGEVVKFSLKNLEQITGGTRGLNPVPPPVLPGLTLDWAQDFRPFYFLTLLILVGTYVLLGGLERSRLGRAWVALREDELAASCMGLNPARLKLAAFVVAAGLAGLAGCLYASVLTSTSDPNTYDFNQSVFILCCLILGGLGSRPGVVFGVFLLYGFDHIASPILDARLQEWMGTSTPKTWQTFSGWRLMVFGIVLILVMRFRPAGLLPAGRVAEEFGDAAHHTGANAKRGGGS